MAPLPDDDDLAPPDDDDVWHGHEPPPPPPPVDLTPPPDAPTPGAVLGRLQSYRDRGAKPTAASAPLAPPRKKRAASTQAPPAPAPAEPPPPPAAPRPEPVAASAPPAPAPEPPPPAAPPPAATPSGPPSPSPSADLPSEDTTAPPTPGGPRRDPARPDPRGSALCDGTRWRRFVHALPREDGMGPVKAALATAGFLSAADGVIHVGFEGTVGLNQARNLSSHPALQESLAEAFGPSARLSFSLDPEGRAGRTLNEEIDRLREERRLALDANARNHTRVQLALGWFEGGRIDGVRLPEIKEVTDVQ